MSKLLKKSLFITLIIVAMTACSSKKEAPAPMRSTVIMPIETRELVNNVKESQVDFREMQIKSKMSMIRDGKEDSYTGQIRMKNDSIVWMTISAFGIEGARGAMTADSIRFIYRPDKVFFAQDIHYLKIIFPFITVDMFSDLLVGNVPINGINIERKLNEDNCYRVDNTLAIFFKESLWINPNNFKVEKLVITNMLTGKVVGTIDYSNYIVVEDQVFPSDIVVKADVKGKTTVVHLQYNNIEFENNLSYPYSVPAKYKSVF